MSNLNRKALGNENLQQPFFLISIDTEGDNLWARPQEVTTENAKFLPRFQSLCEAYGLRPTYLTNFEMARCPAFREFGRDVLKRQAGEIGMHLHAWDSPPLAPLTSEDSRFHPYLIEYPEQVMRDKVAFLTDLLEDTFEVKMLSHRAGRWSFNSTYARILIEQGYKVDSSITPHVSWQAYRGDPNQAGGTDYSHFPELPYFMAWGDIGSVGDSPLLEIPVTIMDFRPAVIKVVPDYWGKDSLPRRVLNRLFPSQCWLRPRGNNRKQMLAILKKAVEEPRCCLNFMLHSSEFMPGGNPTFQSKEDIEALYNDLEILFSTAHGIFGGATLSEFFQEFSGEPVGLAESAGQVAAKRI